jgi:hypothetical protein
MSDQHEAVDHEDMQASQNREMFARFGLAIYHLQCVERSLAMWIAFSNTRNRHISGDQLDYEMSEEFQRTLGQIVLRLDDLPEKLPAAIIDRLPTALKYRNHLVHDYWWEKAAYPLSEKGRLTVINEQQTYIDFFEELDRLLSAEYEPLVRERGIDLGAALDRLLEKSRKDPQPESKPRLLSKREILSKAFRYRFPGDRSKYIPVFSLADGTLWTFGDRGLIPAPEEISREDFEPINELAGDLPAEVNPRPKSHVAWTYFLDLSNGIRLQVTPAPTGKAGAYRWKVLRSK